MKNQSDSGMHPQEMMSHANDMAKEVLDKSKNPVRSPQPGQDEGTVARAIEQQTAKLPSDIFLWAAGGSILASLMMKSRGRDSTANFVGQWAPTFLILGLYNKMVKLMGSDG